jgi:hypothetical protein
MYSVFLQAELICLTRCHQPGQEPSPPSALRQIFTRRQLGEGLHANVLRAVRTTFFSSKNNDIYSFGVVTLALLTGWEVVDSSAQDVGFYLSSFARLVSRSGLASEDVWLGSQRRR